MESQLILDTPLTWMLERSKVILLLMFQFTLPESVLVAPLMVLDFLLESLRNNVLELKSLCRVLLLLSLVTLLVNITHLLEWMRRLDSSLLMITSCLSLEIEILLLLVWRETGLRVVVSSTMLPRPSSFGSMKRISLESSPCRRVGMSRVFERLARGIKAVGDSVKKES